jgi:lipopolysaccharide transport system ATP-binding protein
MSDTVISVEKSGKKYIIGHEKQERYSTLRDSIANGAKSLLKPFQGGKSQTAVYRTEEFWVKFLFSESVSPFFSIATC